MAAVTPDLLLGAYVSGFFPMGFDADSDEIAWFDPPLRGVIPLDGFHIPRSLRRRLRRKPFEIRFDTAFRAVIEACAEPAGDRPETWINRPIVALYCALAERGQAHSVECWEDGDLVGGLYGVALGGAFFGESMFSRRTDASKIALSYLVAVLQHSGFVLLDTQFRTDHLARFGCVEIPKAEYRRRLSQALAVRATFDPTEADTAITDLLAAATPAPT